MLKTLFSVNVRKIALTTCLLVYLSSMVIRGETNVVIVIGNKLRALNSAELKKETMRWQTRYKYLLMVSNCDLSDFSPCDDAALPECLILSNILYHT